MTLDGVTAFSISQEGSNDNGRYDDDVPGWELGNPLEQPAGADAEWRGRQDEAIRGRPADGSQVGARGVCLRGTTIPLSASHAHNGKRSAVIDVALAFCSGPF